MGCCFSAEGHKPSAFHPFGYDSNDEDVHHDRAPPAGHDGFIATLTKGKPLDGSDVSNLASAKKQIMFIRKYAQHFLDNLPISEQDLYNEMNEHFKSDNRSALYEKEDIKSYCKPDMCVRKSDAVKKLIVDSIKSNVLFEDNTEEEICEIVDVFRSVPFKKGDVVIKQGDQGNDFFVVDSGELSIRVTVGDGEEMSEVNVGNYSRGSAFGELALIFGSPRAATITATSDCKLWTINRLAYRGSMFQIRFDTRKEKLALLKNCKIDGRKFPDVFDRSEIHDLTVALKPDQYAEGDALLREGEMCDFVFIVRSGTVKAYRKGCEGEVGTFEREASIGIDSLLVGAVNDATYIAATPLSVYYLSKNAFERMVGNLQDAIAGKSKSRSTIRGEMKTTLSALNKKDELTLEQLNFFNVIGKGDFGQVTLVQAKETGEVYALKSMGKRFIVEKNQQEQVLNEFHILKQLEHPNIGKIHCAMQDDKQIYFLLALLPGGELIRYLMKREKFTEDETRFYAASVVLAFDLIHSIMIAHRDLKPENMVLDRTGYCVLVDFALAKEIDEGQTFTFCGTPDYLAPEIIRGTGHDWGVDYWALGVLLFELTCGIAPFYAPNQSKRTRKILKGCEYLKFPSHFSGGLCDIISELLVLDQSKRLGRTRNGVQAIKNHRWFAGFDWDGLYEKRIEAPIEPDAQSDQKALGQRDVFARSTMGSGDMSESDWWPDFAAV